MKYCTTPLLLLLVGTLAGCGNSQGPVVERLADARDLECVVEPVGSLPDDGLPKAMRFTLVNKSGDLLVVPLPRAQTPGDSVMDRDKFGPPYFLLILKKAGHEREGEFMYTAIQATSRTGGQAALLRPAERWVNQYETKDFYPWGPCGPATDGCLSGCFSPGTEEVSLEAALVLWPGEVLRSKPITLKCSHKPWVFGERVEPKPKR
jgi:hypothetical protein